MRGRAAGLLLGYVADRALGDPRRFHPVAGFGQLAGAMERRLHADSRARGAVFTGLLVGGSVAIGVASEALARRCRASGILATALTATATWAVLGGRSLEREAADVHVLLAAGDVPAARVQVKRLVGRDTSGLDVSEISRAVIESVAENTSDAVVAPLVWGAIGGVPGLLGYRAANTLDAMVGHHSARYERFGWASAKLDDLLNLPGSRLAGLLALVARPSRARESRMAWRRDASAHPSPNAGVVEAAFAGALDIQLGGTNTYYGSRVEHRAVMGSGAAPQPRHIAGATRLARRIDVGAALVCATAAHVLTRRSR